MKRFGTISYNIYGNFTNYGSALQTWALHQAVNRLGNEGVAEARWRAILVDYCPDCLRGADPLNPMANMWDADTDIRKQCELSLPAIQVNAKKFDVFYRERFERTAAAYGSHNFNECTVRERLDGFVCGSDTIFCPDEFDGFDDGYYANYKAMQRRSIAYAASFGDPHFAPEDYPLLDARLNNFLALGLRENPMLPYVTGHTSVSVQRVLDPTLLLAPDDYASLIAGPQEQDEYLLLYSRRYNLAMEQFAEEIAEHNGWKIVEISLRAENAQRHRMFYEAGVEEFLSLVKHARCLVTNSYHGLIFAYQFQVPFFVFSREQCDTKISEILDILGLLNRLLVQAPSPSAASFDIDWDCASRRIAAERGQSLSFLRDSLLLLDAAEG